MRNQAIFLWTILLIFTVGVGGCFSSNQGDIKAFSKPSKIDVTADNYILQPPDEVEIFCSKIPEIDKQRQQIRPDGKITLEALGEVHAAGRTPKELSDILVERAILLYALTGENPIDVRVAVYQSQYYYVLGQVYFEGPKVCTGRDTVLTALAAARPTALAWVERIQVIRPSADENVLPKIFEFNYDKMSAHGDTSKNVLLQEGDIIFVPPTILAGVALKVEEFVRPIGRAFSTVNIVEGAPARR